MARAKTKTRKASKSAPAASPAAPSPLRQREAQREKRSEAAKTIFFAVLIALVIRTLFIQAFRIPSGSMEDTLLIGDFLLVDKITYGAKIPLTPWRLPGFRDPRRGDILVFKDPRSNRDYIKRCVATGGETIELRDNQVLIDGNPIPEPYKAIKPVPGPTRDDYGPHLVAPDHLFMMGDNRNNSQDSRYWNDLDPRRVVGRAFVLYWSTDPEKSPRWVRNMSESWVKGLLQLFLGRPRIRRVGRWLAKDYTSLYEQGLALEVPAPARAAPDVGQALATGRRAEPVAVASASSR